MAATVTFVTCVDVGEAHRIARTLVDERLAACCSIVKDVQSIYRWKDAVQESNEVFIIIKSDSTLFDKLCQRVKDLHSYDVPEIISLPVSQGLPEYLSWISESVTTE